MKCHNDESKNYRTYMRPWLVSLGFHAVVAVVLCFSLDFELRSLHHKKSVAVSAVFSSAHATHVDAPQIMPSAPVIKNPVAQTKQRHLNKNNHAKIETASIAADSRVGDSHAPAHESELRAQHAPTIRAHPTLINRDDVKIPYPEQARQMMIEGIVTVRLTVSEAGRVIDAQIVSGPYYGLRQAALMVVRKLFFLPATDENGQAKIAYIDHEVVFRLNKRL